MRRPRRLTGGVIELLELHRNGEIISDFSEACAKAVEATELTNKSAEVTLKVKLSPPKKGHGRILGVSMEVIAKIPKAAPYISIWYVNDDKKLVREDPNQRKLDLRVVPMNQPQQAADGGVK